MRALVLALGALLAPALAHADDEIVRGAIVKIEAQEIYVNIGVDRGVTGGASVRIKRPVALRHPVTRAPIQDWIPIGSASVTQAGAVMSRARSVARDSHRKPLTHSPFDSSTFPMPSGCATSATN